VNKPKVSVLLCTHNPREEFLSACLEGLRGQSLPLKQCELIVVDNASTSDVQIAPLLAWHPNGRLVREDKLGLTHARLRGFAQAAADLFVLVDDDNILKSDFLETAIKLAEEWPFLGAFGGQSHPQWEKTPPEWTRRYWHLLGIREFLDDRWSNVLGGEQPVPIGAGMVVRRCVAERYATVLMENPARAALDRAAGKLTSCGDTDLALVAIDLGLGTGQFSRLELQHLMPLSRVEEKYLAELIHGIHYSATILASFRQLLPPPPSRSERILKWYEGRHVDPRVRNFDQIERDARDAARRALASFHLASKTGPK
jgi:glycosyltransferase involved in cell wall biosynthesis